jgi:hypothetical protein
MDKMLIYGLFETIRILVASHFEIVRISAIGRYVEMNFFEISKNRVSKIKSKNRNLFLKITSSICWLPIECAYPAFLFKIVSYP